ncbi:response regulator transcription factor [Carboxylicivirga sp. N1Y90]|uniref:response regulator transcription factor n=1 Tax=Carboxylicivirga fragile TaxID=3417571 RepID=UPI003D34F661|nr:helix-turn-helix transcriptional regulator [Marinilabiliaceae bacterium N1Y90]
MNNHIANIDFLSQKLSLDEIAELIPGWLHVNNIIDFGLLYMSPRMESDCKISFNEVKELEFNYMQDFVHPETLERAVPQLLELVESGDSNRTLSFYQYIKLPEKEYEWYHTSSKLFNKESVISISIPLSVLQDFDQHIVEILNENIFLKINLEKYKSLSNREKEIIKLLIQGTSNTQIAESINISEFTVKTHRRNIYRKLNICNVCDLVRFAQMYNIK